MNTYLSVSLGLLLNAVVLVAPASAEHHLNHEKMDAVATEKYKKCDVKKDHKGHHASAEHKGEHHKNCDVKKHHNGEHHKGHHASADHKGEHHKNCDVKKDPAQHSAPEAMKPQ